MIVRTNHLPNLSLQPSPSLSSIPLLVLKLSPSNRIIPMASILIILVTRLGKDTAHLRLLPSLRLLKVCSMTPRHPSCGNSTHMQATALELPSRLPLTATRQLRHRHPQSQLSKARMKLAKWVLHTLTPSHTSVAQHLSRLLLPRRRATTRTTQLWCGRRSLCKCRSTHSTMGWLPRPTRRSLPRLHPILDLVTIPGLSTTRPRIRATPP